MMNKQPRSWFPHWLGFIFVLFIGILVYVYVEARKANPVILDETGKIRQSVYDDGRK